MSHDQSFKNLILDYPHQALAFFAEAEALDLPREVRITPIRQEQLQERLGERFRELDVLPYRRYRDSDNLVARLNLPNMHYAPEERVDVYAAAVRGLSTLEPDRERQLKYADFIDIYSALDHNEQERYATEYPSEAQTVSTYFQLARQEGRQEGEALILQRQMRLKFGELPEEARRRIESADADTLLAWSERILTAERIEDVIH